MEDETVTYAQKTIEEMVASEKQLVLDAEQRYGDFYLNAKDATVFFSVFIKSVDPDCGHFISLFGLAKKHHTLSLLSTARLHQVQSIMNRRQTLEAVAMAAFALANRADEHFIAPDGTGFFEFTQKMRNKMLKWLEKEFESGSQAIKRIKDQLQAGSHANPLYAANTFERKEDAYNVPFFDIQDEYLEKIDLWQIADIAAGSLDLIYGVSEKYGGIVLRDNARQDLSELFDRNRQLLATLMQTDRYRKTANLILERSLIQERSGI